MEALRLLLAGALLTAALPAAAVYRCESGGRIVYQDASCPGGQPLTFQEAPAATEAEQRAVREKRQLAEIEQAAARRKEESRKKQDRNTRAETAIQKRCEKLAARAKWTTEEAAKASEKNIDKTRRKAERAVQQYDTECSGVEEKRHALTGTSH